MNSLKNFDSLRSSRSVSILGLIAQCLLSCKAPPQRHGHSPQPMPVCCTDDRFLIDQNEPPVATAFETNAGFCGILQFHPKTGSSLLIRSGCVKLRFFLTWPSGTHLILFSALVLAKERMGFVIQSSTTRGWR